MSVNSVSSVRFCAAAQAPATNVLERPGKFSKPADQSATQPATQDVAKEEKSGACKKILTTVAGLLVVAAALVALPKFFPNAIKVLSAEEKDGAKWTQKIGHYVALAGSTIAKYTYEPIVKLFSHKK